MFWNGQTWTAVGSGFAASTDVAQLTMVPLQNTHTANSIVESDRMLWISGALSDTSFGNASAALYDGENIIPYIITAEESGTAGAVASLFHSFSSFSFTQRRKCNPVAMFVSILLIFFSSQTSWPSASLS